MHLSAVDFADHGRRLGIDPKNPPGIVISHKKTRYLFDKSTEFSAANLQKFIQDYFDNKLTTLVRSEPIPQQKPNDPMTIVVANNYDEVVVNNDLDVFIFFYAPWCQFCKKALPVWQEFAASVKEKGTKGLIIAMIDANANDVPEEITSFPTFYFKKGTQRGVKKLEPSQYYFGNHEVASFAEFVKKHATTARIEKRFANIHKIKRFLEKFDSFKEEVMLLVEENESLVQSVDELSKALEYKLYGSHKYTGADGTGVDGGDNVDVSDGTGEAGDVRDVGVDDVVGHGHDDL